MQTLTAPVTGAFRKARQAMQGNPASLDAGLTELKRLTAVLQKVEAERDAHNGRFRTDCNELEKRFQDAPTLENEIAFRVARIVVDEDLRRSPAVHPSARGDVYYAEKAEVWQEFVKREPNWH